MFARVLEINTKKGQAHALCTAAEQKVLPLVKKQPGLLDVLWMVPDESPDTVLAISFWENREAAEKYRIQGYPSVAEIYLPFVEGGIRVRHCDITVAPAFAARAAGAR